MLWTHHHSLLDGWSVPLVYRDVMLTYGKLRRGEEVELGEAPEYERYMEWLGKQDEEEARRYWREYLEGVERVTELPFDKAGRGEEIEHRMEGMSLEEGATAELKGLAKQHGTTVRWQLRFGG